MADSEKMDYAGKRILVTAGPTAEDIDPVRFISNRSTGKMGVAMANAAARRGAVVLLIHGPLPAPPALEEGIEAIQTRSASEMYSAAMARISGIDCAILAAAVCDFTPISTAPSKIKKEDRSNFVVELKRTPDILAALGSLADKPFLVGFAAESENVSENALRKMKRKNCDMICANHIGQLDTGFASENNEITIFKRSGEFIKTGRASKYDIANLILDEISRCLFESM